MKKLEYFLLIVILFGALSARLYKFHEPVADWHSWRQVDTSAVSRNFVKSGFDIFHPKFDDISKNVSMLDNPLGHRFVEFPIYNVFQAGLFAIFKYFTLEEWGRLVTIFSSLFSIWFIYLIVRKYVSIRAGLLASFFFAFVPFNIYYGRSILPDSMMVATLLGGFYFFDLWTEENLKLKTENSKLKLKTKNFLLYFFALVLVTSALLLKPFALFWGLPFAVLAYMRFGFRFVIKWQVWFFAIASVIPLIFWRKWMLQYPQGIPGYEWLYNGNGIRFKGAFFQWIFAERISRIILGYLGLPFVILGLLFKNKQEGLLLFSFTLSTLAYLFVIATGNVQHDYYQILIIPTLAMLFGKGVDFLLSNTSQIFNRFTTYTVVLISFGLMIGFGWYIIREYYNVRLDAVAAGKAVDQLVPSDAKIIAPLTGDTTLLYYTNRKGWPAWERTIREFLDSGATHMVFINPTAPELNFINYFGVVEQKENYIIYDLRKVLPKAYTELELE